MCCQAPEDTPPRQPYCPVDGGEGILGCIHVCSEEEVGHGLSQGRFQVVHSWHVCAAGSVTKDPRWPPPCPVWATPLIVSDRRNWFQLTPIQRPFEWQTKDTATWRLMLVRSILEVVPSPPALSLCPPPPTGFWVGCFSLITLCITAGLNRNLWWNVQQHWA